MSLAVYKSSAGSGKTFTLVKEYIKIVVQSPSAFRHILAITFTNKAATEMKSRILSYLDGLAGDPEMEKTDMVKVLINDLKDHTGLDEQTIQQRAGVVLKHILHGYSNFAVSTIDSFVHRLVRSFARELELPVNFDVEMDQDKLITKSIEMLMAKVGNDPALTRTLVSFVESRMDDEKSWDVERELRKFVEILLRESSADAIQSLRELDAGEYVKIQKQISNLQQQMEDELVRPAAEAMKLIGERNIQPGEFYYGKSSMYGFFKRIADRDFSKPEPNKYVNTMMESGNWISGKCSAAPASAIETLKPQLTRLLEETVENAERLLPRIYLFRLINQNIYPTAVLSEIEQVMQEFRENENIVHISEFNKRIAKIIGPEPVPFIYERIGEKYRHFLVDEFQDTSVLQWQNLLPLFENSLAANHFNMIVGDGKQAIYRWRNGEVEQFAALPEIFKKPGQEIPEARENLLRHHYNEQFLKTNYRSRSEIVNFNNSFFKSASEGLSEQLGKIYQQHDQQFNPEDTGGRVQIELLHVENLTTQEKLVLELERILTLIKGFESEFKLSEITVLTRTNEDASYIAQFLLEKGYSVVTSEALRLVASQEVRFTVNVMRYLMDPANQAVIADMLVFLFKKTAMPFTRFHEILKAVSEIHPGNDATRPFDELIRKEFDIAVDWQKLAQLNLYEMVVQIEKDFLLDPNGNNSFLRFFRDTVLNFSSAQEEDVSDFLEHWDEKGYKDSIVIPENTEAVRVMTIHKAKGLQFPVVIHPFTKGKSRLGIEEIWIEPEIEEIPQLKKALVKTTATMEKTKFSELREQEISKTFLDQLNVLYVAMTRPKERLAVLMHDKHNEKGVWKEGKPVPDTPDLLYKYLTENGLWQDGKTSYVFGDEGKRINKDVDNKKTTTDEETEKLAIFKKVDWKEKVTIRFKSFKNWDLESGEKNRDFGIMVHNILSRIRTRDDVRRAVDQAVLDGELDEKLGPRVVQEIQQIIDHPKVTGFFDSRKKIITEQDIILEDGQLLRPDRVLVDDDETALIDYKTGKPDEKHRKQLDGYAGALAAMGYQNIRNYLIYLNLEAGNPEVVAW